MASDGRTIMAVSSPQRRGLFTNVMNWALSLGRNGHNGNLPAKIRGPGDIPMARAFSGLTLRDMIKGKGIKQPYREHAWVYSCISTIAQNISQVPYRHYQGEEDKKQRVQDSNELVVLFDQPNTLPTMSRYQFFEAIFTYLEIYGSAIIAMPGRPSLTAVPTAMYPASPVNWRADIDKKTGWPLGWIQTVGAKEIPYSLHQVLYLRYFNPYDPIAGMGPLEAARLGVDQDYWAGQYNSAFFENGAFPGGLLIFPEELDDDAYDRLQKEWEERHKGPDNSFKVAILEGGADYKQTILSHKDMEFLEQKKWNRQEICSVFGVPPEVIGFGKDTYQNVFQARRLFWADTLVRKMRYYQDYTWGAFYKYMLGGRYWGEFDTSGVEALQEDFKAKVDTGYKLWQMGYPINDINERVALGLPKKPWGDAAWLPINLQPVDDAPDTSNSPALGGGDEPAAEPAKKPKKPKKELAAPVTKGSLSWEHYLKSLTPLVTMLHGKFKRYFFNQRKTVLVAFYDLAKDDTFTANDLTILLEHFAEEDAKLVGMTAPLFTLCVGAGLQMIADEVGGDATVDPDAEAVQAFLTQKKFKVVGVNKAIKERLHATLDEGIKNKESVSTLAARIRSLYNFVQARSLPLVQAEAASTLGGGRFLGMKQVGVEGSLWRTAKNEQDRDSHKACDGQMRALGEPYPNGLRFPCDLNADPSEVLGCTCLIVPVPKLGETPPEEEEEEEQENQLSNDQVRAMIVGLQGVVNSLAAWR